MVKSCPASAMDHARITIASVQAMLLQIWSNGGHWTASFAAVANVAVAAAALERLARWQADSKALTFVFDEAAQVYRYAAAALFVVWGFHFVPAEWLVLFFTVCATLLFVAGALAGRRAIAHIGVEYAALGLISVVQIGHAPSWLELAGILLVPASMRLARRIGSADSGLSDDVRNFLTAGAVVAAWWWVTRWSLAGADGGNLTIAWSVLALLTFGAGLGLRERIYRLGGFAILALAIGHVFLIDVWKLETIYRVLSFLVLGAVLLLLSFVYNRFAEQIRRWL